MPTIGSRKCLHCNTFFKPSPRAKGRQNYCSDSACQKASKRASQQKWLQKPENQDYFRGIENVRRVQRWRAKNPGYSKTSHQALSTPDALQDVLITQVTEKKKKTTELKQEPLQELLIAQPAVLIGLIAHLSGGTLQDDIVETGRRLKQLGEDFLRQPYSPKGEHHVIPLLT
jgi:hypothetical protein